MFGKKRSAKEPTTSEHAPDTAPAEAQEKLSAPQQEISSESGKRSAKDIQRWNFAVHLFKRFRDGERGFLGNGIQGIRDEYREYRELKDQTAQKYETYDTVLANATDTSEYYVLLVLSCLIATFGLLADSAAIIIGAMIVAPLMGPILGFSAAVLWGKGRDLWETITTLIKGAVLVLAITSGLTFILPYVPIGEQILLRTQPGLIDIGVAIASGLVGAYAYANRKISTSLTGVAISVALMPPLCTVGIGIGTLNWQMAGGAGLLFAINMLGISFAALVVFFLIRLHPQVTMDEGEKSRFVRRALGQALFSLILLLAIAVPMVFLSYQAIEINSQRSQISEHIERRILEQFPGAEFDLSVEYGEGGWSVRTLIYASGGAELTGAPGALSDSLSRELTETVTDQPVDLGLFLFDRL